MRAAYAGLSLEIRDTQVFRDICQCTVSEQCLGPQICAQGTMFNIITDALFLQYFGDRRHMASHSALRMPCEAVVHHSVSCAPSQCVAWWLTVDVYT